MRLPGLPYFSPPPAQQSRDSRKSTPAAPAGAVHLRSSQQSRDSRKFTKSGRGSRLWTSLGSNQEIVERGSFILGSPPHIGGLQQSRDSRKWSGGGSRCSTAVSWRQQSRDSRKYLALRALGRDPLEVARSSNQEIVESEART